MFSFDDVTFALQIDFFMPFQYNRVSARAASRDKCVSWCACPVCVCARVTPRALQQAQGSCAQLALRAGYSLLG